MQVLTSILKISFSLHKGKYPIKRRSRRRRRRRRRRVDRMMRLCLSSWGIGKKSMGIRWWKVFIFRLRKRRANKYPLNKIKTNPRYTTRKNIIWRILKSNT
jgi:hypothetical protein